MEVRPGSDLVWRERFFRSTRGRVLLLLRREPRTSAELAEALGISANAARGHLASLERDGLAKVIGMRREGVGKPPRLFAASEAAEALFPKAYDAVLASLLDVLEDRVGPAVLGDVLRQAGRRAGREASTAGGAPLERALDVLAELGAEVEVEEGTEGTWLRGHACPLGGLVPRRPELCALMASLLAEVTGKEVTDHCLRGSAERPRCAFLLHPERPRSRAARSPRNGGPT